MEFLIIALVLFLLGRSFISPSQNASLVSNVYNRCYNYAEKYSAGNGLTHYVTTDEILAIICQESGGQISKGISNDNIVGDNNSAFGVMQIHQDALAQVNNVYSLDYSIADIRNSEEKNIEVGACYLDWCLSQNQNQLIPYYYAFEMYNGGSSSYADSTNNYLSILKGLSK